MSYTRAWGSVPPTANSQGRAGLWCTEYRSTTWHVHIHVLGMSCNRSDDDVSSVQEILYSENECHHGVEAHHLWGV